MVWRLRFRRSVGSRFFRVNFTKRGVGASIGVPGYRKTWHSTGRTTETVSIPGTGMSWQNVHPSKPIDQQATETDTSQAPPGGTVEDAIELIEDIQT